MKQSCLDKERAAANILEDRNASEEQVKAAKEFLLNSARCHSCNNPLVSQYSMDDLLCEKIHLCDEKIT